MSYCGDDGLPVNVVHCFFFSWDQSYPCFFLFFFHYSHLANLKSFESGHTSVKYMSTPYDKNVS